MRATLPAPRFLSMRRRLAWSSKRPKVAAGNDEPTSIVRSAGQLERPLEARSSAAELISWSEVKLVGRKCARAQRTSGPPEPAKIRPVKSVIVVQSGRSYLSSRSKVGATTSLARPNRSSSSSCWLRCRPRSVWPDELMLATSWRLKIKLPPTRLPAEISIYV